MATAHLHAPAEAANRILPAVGPLTIDPVAEVRRTALQALSDFSKVLKDHSSVLDEQAAAAGEPKGLCGHPRLAYLRVVDWLLVIITISTGELLL